MTVYEYLNQLKRIDSDIERKQKRKRELWAEATSTTPNINGMPHATGVSDKVGNAATKIATVNEEINSLTDKYVDKRRDITEHLRMLPEKQRDVLRWLYVEKRENPKPSQKPYYTWSEVAKKMGCSEQNISKLRRNGIKNLQKILDSEGKIQKMG